MIEIPAVTLPTILVPAIVLWMTGIYGPNSDSKAE